MARITVEDCIDKFSSRFELVLVASNRARKLHSGEEPTVDKDNDKNSVIALREIAEGTISAEEAAKNAQENALKQIEIMNEKIEPGIQGNVIKILALMLLVGLLVIFSKQIHLFWQEGFCEIIGINWVIFHRL